ncbi:MAG: DUF192 domain-containing protein [Bacteroides sp.]|nr:DUF192 domain-containing protein [Prevotella sp.]MCM1407141.1 DUF192 domain-containing protein [Treponema brennaborense]MCM1470293.1 DUF192 domain-containing protein [Bacteroides sp.]
MKKCAICGVSKCINYVLLFAVCAALYGCGSRNSLKKITLTIETQAGQISEVCTELALTEAQRMRGFMGRKKIPAGTGMLFVFDYDIIADFWMKNTLVPLSIAYIDSRGIIRNIYDMTPHSLASVTSTVSVRYALEVPQGWFAEAGIAVGDRLILPASF